MATAPFPSFYGSPYANPSATTYPPQIHHHNSFGFGAPAPAYAPAPVPAYTPAAATHFFSSPYVSAPAPFPSTFPPLTSSSTSFPFGSSHVPVYATAPATFSSPYSQAPQSTPPTPAPPPVLVSSATPAQIFPTTASVSKMQPDPAPLFGAPLPASRMQRDTAPVSSKSYGDLACGRPNSSSDILTKGGEKKQDSGATSQIEKNGNSTAALSRPPLDCLHDNVFDGTTEVTTTASASVGSGYYASSTSTGPTPFLGFIASSGSKTTASTTVSAPATSASTVPSATAYATQVFGEIPTPKSCPRTHASALHYYQEHVTPVQSTFVPDRNRNLTEQHLDAMSQQYGFHNLNRRSVFLADGSKHSYFALPETYPLERAVPEPGFDVYDDETKGCTDEFVDEFASTREQQLYEDPQVNVLVIHERRKEWDPGEHAIRSSTRNTDIAAETYPLARASPNSESDGCSNDFVHVYTGTHEQQLYEEEQPQTEHSSICLNISSTVRDFTLEMQQQDNEKTSVNVQQLKAPPLNVLVIDEPRNEWRPGEHTVGAQHRNEVFVKCNSWLSIVLQSMGYQVEGLNPLSLTTPWDPGVLVLHSGITSNHTSITKHAEWLKLQCMEFYKFAIVHTLAVKFGASRAINFKSATMRSHAFGVDWKKVNVSALFFLVVPCSTARSQATQSLFLSHSGDNRTNHSYLKLFIQSICAATARQVTEQRHLLEPSLMVVMLLNGSIFTEGQLAYMPQGTSISCSEWVRHMAIILTCWFTPFEMAKPQWNSGIALASDMYSLLEILRAGCQTMKTLTWLQSPNFSALQYQLPVSNTCYVWDPGILIIWDMMLGNTTAHMLCLGSSYSNNIKVAELTSRCLGFQLQHINNWTSQISNVITSYAYTMDFVNDQWAFLHQNDVQKNYNAKSLISPKNYLQLSEMDIIFTTFLPP